MEFFFISTLDHQQVGKKDDIVNIHCYGIQLLNCYKYFVCIYNILSDVTCGVYVDPDVMATASFLFPTIDFNATRTAFHFLTHFDKPYAASEGYMFEIWTF